MMNIEDLYRLLRTGHVQAQGIVETITDPMLVLDEALRVQNANRAFLNTFKVDRDETIGRLIYDLGDGQWDIPDLRRLLLEVIPKSTAVINYEVEHDFPKLGVRTMLLTARRLHHPDNASHSMLLAIVDATDRIRRELAKDMLFGELRHRMKNLLALTQALARQTTTEGRSAEEYREAFIGRLGALIEAEDLAFSEQTGAGLKVLIERILAPYEGRAGAVEVDAGPSIELGPNKMMALSMVLHELVTNAAKYGALSVPEGRLRIAWRVDDGSDRLRIRWEESGGPPVTPPTVSGYGTRLIDSALTYNLDGSVERCYAVGGLEVEIAVPLGNEAHLS